MEKTFLFLDPPKLEFYVHYEGMDRRLDEWVDKSRFVDPVSQPPITPSQVTETAILTRAQRRIQEEFQHVPINYDDMDPLNAKLEREHEEVFS